VHDNNHHHILLRSLIQHYVGAIEAQTSARIGNPRPLLFSNWKSGTDDIPLLFSNDSKESFRRMNHRHMPLGV
jgi:hypothetical protein